MSTNTMRKLEKTKVRVVFRLQFHATHIPQTGWNNLFISFIPSDSCKATAKTNKANVRNGNCKWADPIYETTRFLQDSKTNQYEEKVYKLVVAMGASRSSLLGEANINLSDYVDASKPSVVALPLHGSDSGAILHVSVQLLTSKTSFREFEQLREVGNSRLPANTDHDGGILSTVGEVVVSHADKVDPRLRFKPNPKELPSLEVESGFSEGYANSTAGIDGSSNTSGNFCAEKHYNSRTRDLDSIRRSIYGDLGQGLPSESPTMDKGHSDHPFLVHGTGNWVHQWDPEASVNREMAILYEENSQLKRVLEKADLSIDELRKEIASLQNFALSSEQSLAKEVSMVKAECLRFKHDLEFVRNIKISAQEKVDTGVDMELCHPEGVLLPGLVTSETSSVDGSIVLKGDFFKLLQEVDESKAERENVVRKMGQMECYYETMIQELEEAQKKILGELRNLRHEHSSCIYTVSSTKAQMDVMHQQMNHEHLLNKELERRAATSEAALRQARMNYSIAVNHLQKDLGVLSLQVLSMYETNENLIGKTLEASQPFLRGCEEAEIASHVAEGSDVDQSMESQSRNIVLKNHLDLKSSVGSQEDLYRKMQEEVSEMLLVNINLDVFSVTLHQALLEASLDSRKEMHDLEAQLELSCRSNQSLRLKLQNMSNEICTLKEEKVVSIFISNDLDLENQTLEEKLRSVSDAKCVLSERIRELESLVAEYKNYKSKYKSCEVENEKLTNQLEQVATDKHHLSNEVSLLQEEVMTMKIKVSENEKLQKVVNHIQEKLENLLAIGDEQLEQVNGLLPHNKEENNTGCEKLMSVIMRLEERLLNCNDKILQLMEENKNLLNERDVARLSFAGVEAELKVAKQEFERDLLDMVSKLNASNALVEKLQTDFEALNNKLQVCSEKEEKCVQMTRNLLCDFNKMEASLQELTLENGDLVDRIMAFGNVTDELEDNKLTIDELKQENLSLTGLLQYNINGPDVLTKELADLKRTAESLQDELSLLRGIRDQFDTQISDLNSQLKERDNKLTRFDQQEAELNHLKQQLSDVESEKISLLHQLSYAHKQLKKVLKESATDSESQLLEMHGFLIATDVVQTVVVKQYKLHVEELFWELEYFHKNLEEADKKNLDNYAAENASLLSYLKSLKSILEYNVALNQALEHSNSGVAAELKECKEKIGTLEAKFADDKNYKFEIGELKRLLRSSQTENEDLAVSKEELEIRSLVLQTTIDEMSAKIIFHRGCTEDHLQAYEKREFDRSSFASKDSLRIAFIKEEYETKLEEIRHQLLISEKHGEGMLWKLQDALDDLEKRKKCEASQLKRNEELLLKIAELETELQSVVSDNHKNLMAYKQLKADLDCLVMSLDCCKEEKNQLTSSLQECNDYKCKLTNEVELLKKQLQNLKAAIISAENNKIGCHVVINSQNRSSDYGNLVKSSLLISTACCKEEALEEGNLTNFSDDQANHWTYSKKLTVDKQYGREVNPQASQGALLTNATEDLSDQINSEIDVKHNGYLLKDQLKPQILMSVIERLPKELEQMKSENTLLPGGENPDELVGEVSQRDQVHLVKVSEELENMSSLYNDSSRSENTFGKGLAKALQAKNSSIQFLSSFPKLDSHEAAVFQSFGSINELIKDMLWMKERYGAMETELKEMHERYSQLSLDFAEVEGERQKIVLMLKNLRLSKSLLSRSLTCSHEELSL